MISRSMAIGLAILGVVALAALCAPWLGLPDPNATAPADRLLPPLSAGHWLGTDSLGRDLAARVVWGTRVSLALAIGATLVAAVLGSSIGLLAGYAGGRTDQVLMRGMDSIMAFPYVLLALAIVAALGPGLVNALLAIAVVNIPFFARNVRGLASGLSRREFVDAARLSGQSHLHIVFVEILPNVMPVIVVTLSATFGWMILETAGLSFLGLGAQPPQADLGSMLGQGRKVMFTAPHVTIVPGLTIFVVVMSANLIGDGLRDAIDPRLRGGVAGRPLPATVVRRAHEPGQRAVGLSAPLAPILSVDRLRTEFRTRGRTLRAVDDVDLALSAGECLGLVGESGSGKSVTAMSITRLVASPPGIVTGGRVCFDGRDLLAAQPESLRRIRGARIAHVFQDPMSTLHPMLRIGDQFHEAQRAHRPTSYRAAREQAVHLLARVGLHDPQTRLRAFAHTLSGGMRQRVGLAISLVHDIEVLIADEPTTALDVTVQAQVLALLDELRRERGLAMMFITHDFAVVGAICDRVAVMYAGRIVETGDAAQVLEAPAHPYTDALIACVPRLGAGRRVPAAIEGQPPDLDSLPEGCAFAPRCPRARRGCEKPVELRAHAGGGHVRCHFPLRHEATHG